MFDPKRIVTLVTSHKKATALLAVTGIVATFFGIVLAYSYHINVAEAPKNTSDSVGKGNPEDSNVSSENKPVIPKAADTKSKDQKTGSQPSAPTSAASMPPAQSTPPTAISPPTGGVQPNVSLLGWQKTRSNTGLASVGLNCDSLPAYTGPNPIPAGSRLSRVRFTDHVWLSNGDIVIDRSCFKPSSVGRGIALVSTTWVTGPTDGNGIPNQKSSTSTTISNSDFDGSLLGPAVSAHSTCGHGTMNLINNYCHDFGSGFAIMDAGLQLSVTIEHNYVTDLTADGNPATTGNHSDGFTIRDFNISANPSRQAIVRNNRFNTDSANTTGSLFLQDTWSNGIGNVQITGNLIEGLGWEMAGERRSAAITNINVTNNRFGGTIDGGYGACYTGGGFAWTSWSQNYINNPGALDNKGSSVGC